MAGVSCISTDGIGISSDGSGTVGVQGSREGITNRVLRFPFSIEFVLEFVNNSKNGVEIGRRAESL